MTICGYLTITAVHLRALMKPSLKTIRDQLGLEPTGRPAKSTTSITEKLHRESIRLTQIQDIAGCRIVISDIAEQERVVAG
jgi:ppGpp synthetase/RelA/SpoT-type nucleotidyltranferase